MVKSEGDHSPDKRQNWFGPGLEILLVEKIGKMQDVLWRNDRTVSEIKSFM